MAGAVAHNLPHLFSTFVGREQEIAAVNQWIVTNRLVTLTGVGGCGKTRLAVESASKLLDDFAEGVWLIEFAPLADPEFVVQAVATILGVREQPPNQLADSLADYLAQRHTLLIFDNCEHLLPACAQLVTVLLQRCPGLHILTTSREPLGVTGEVAWPVPPLSLPAYQPWQDPSSRHAALVAYQQSEAVRLFVARAVAASPAFSLNVENGGWVAEICRCLDGLPLAIELAAARVRALSVQEIAQRLDDRFDLLTGGSRTAPPRQQTLAAALDWSYNLLSSVEQRVLQRMAVFAGGCTLEAAEAVCSDDLVDKAEILDTLARLVDKSLVVADHRGNETRYRLLETIRQYAQVKLQVAGELNATQERHFDYYLDWAEQGETYLRGPDQIAWLTRHEAEHDNLRSALEWCGSFEVRSVSHLRLAVACASFWSLCAYVTIGVAHLTVALAHAGVQAPAAMRGWALSYVARLLYFHSDFPAMRRFTEEALAIWRELGREGYPGLAFTLGMLGELAVEEGDSEHALVFFQESLELCRELDDVRGICAMLMQFAWAALRTGDAESAALHMQEQLALAQRVGDVLYVAYALSGLGEVAVRQGQYERTRELLTESLRLTQACGYTWIAGTVLGSLGWLAMAQHDYGRMRLMLGESLAIRMEISDRGGTAWCLEKLAEATLLQSRTVAAGDRDHYCQAAVRIYGAAEALRTPVNSAIDPVDQPGYLRNLATLRSALGTASFDAAWAEGQAMPTNAAIAYALAAPAPSAASHPPEHESKRQTPGGLTTREREVAVLIAQGKSNREIAQALTVSVKAVETYMTRILTKLGFDSRVQVATWVLQQELASNSRSADHNPSSL